VKMAIDIITYDVHKVLTAASYISHRFCPITPGCEHRDVVTNSVSGPLPTHVPAVRINANALTLTHKHTDTDTHAHAHTRTRTRTHARTHARTHTHLQSEVIVALVERTEPQESCRHWNVASLRKLLELFTSLGQDDTLSNVPGGTYASVQALIHVRLLSIYELMR
jgi:hypothetical protein